jgi:hypothetical protein
MIKIFKACIIGLATLILSSLLLVRIAKLRVRITNASGAPIQQIIFEISGEKYPLGGLEPSCSVVFSGRGYGEASYGIRAYSGDRELQLSDTDTYLEGHVDYSDEVTVTSDRIRVTQSFFIAPLGQLASLLRSLTGRGDLQCVRSHK